MSLATTIITRWWLVRHAPVINPGGGVYGQRDLDADTSDAASFQSLAARVPKGAAWVVSHLVRTHQTAQAIAAAAGWAEPALRVEPDLAEQNFGDWQGMSHKALAAQRPRETRRFWLAPASERPPGGESFVEVAARVGETITRLNRDLAGQDVVAVLHGGSIRAALALALDLAPETALRFRVDTLSLTRVEHFAGEAGEPDRWRVVAVNLPAAFDVTPSQTPAAARE